MSLTKPVFYIKPSKANRDDDALRVTLENKYQTGNTDVQKSYNCLKLKVSTSRSLNLFARKSLLPPPPPFMKLTALWTRL